MTTLLANWRLIAALGLAAAIAILFLLWRGAEAEADREQAAHEATVANYRAAAALAEQQQTARNARVAAEQSAINERTSREYQVAIADARARADSLRASANRSIPRPASVPGVPVPAERADGAPVDDGLPAFALDERLIATEQAIRLDALQGWVREQVAVPVNPVPENGP